MFTLQLIKSDLKASLNINLINFWSMQHKEKLCAKYCTFKLVIGMLWNWNIPEAILKIKMYVHTFQNIAHLLRQEHIFKTFEGGKDMQTTAHSLHVVNWKFPFQSKVMMKKQLKITVVNWGRAKKLQANHSKLTL